MKWSARAEAAISKVPFFVRKRVRKKVEAHSTEKGKQRVDLADVTELKQKFLSKGGMESQIKGYDVSACFGGDGCPNVAVSTQELARDIETLIKEADILGFLKANVKGDLKFHHEFKVSLSCCPNGCSRPQITDIGIIGAQKPRVGEAECSLCSTCCEICPDRAVTLPEGADAPLIDMNTCQSCGKCIRACPTGTMEEETAGFRVLLGGRLGRHPRLGMEVSGIQSHDQVLAIVKNCLTFYKANSKNGQRFAKILDSPNQVLDIPAT